MEIVRFSLERGAIRFAIDGSWTCAEFSSFLTRTDDVYRRLNSVFIIREAIEAEARKNQAHQESKEYDRQDVSWQNQFFGGSYRHPMGIVGLDPYVRWRGRGAP